MAITTIKYCNGSSVEVKHSYGTVKKRLSVAERTRVRTSESDMISEQYVERMAEFVLEDGRRVGVHADHVLEYTQNPSE